MGIIKESAGLLFWKRHKILHYIYIAISLLLSVIILYKIPYQRTFVAYLCLLFNLGPSSIIIVLYIPLGLLFRLFGKKIPHIVNNTFSAIVDFVSIVCYLWLIPLFVITLAYLFTLLKHFYLLFIIFIGIFGVLAWKISKENRIISKESNISVIYAVRKKWINTYLKWAVLCQISLLLILICGVLEHSHFTIIDSIVMSLGIFIAFYYFFFDAYFNSYSNDYSNEQFVFFLRSFKVDELIESNILSAIHDVFVENFHYRKTRLLRIGNPNLKMYISERGVDTFFLPKLEWQPIVKRYIHEALVIVVLINVNKKKRYDIYADQTNFTAGVIWELYNNFDCCKKFIYCIDEISTLDVSDFLNVLDNEKRNQSLTSCIVKLINENKTQIYQDDRCVFTFDSNQCLCFKDIKSAVKYKLNIDIYESECLSNFEI